MKKRVLAIVAAAVLALGCVSMAAAAPAKELSKTAAGKKAKKWLEGKECTLNGVTFLSDEEEDYVIDTIGGDDYSTALEILARLYAQYKPKPVRIFDLVCEDADEDDPVEIKIVDNDIKATKNYVTYHYNKASAIWDTPNVQVTGKHDGWVSVKVYKASPVALCTGSGSSAPTNNNGSANGGKVAPKTGEV